jgi:RecJ-like exonuclease
MPTVQLDDNPTPSECPDCKGSGRITLLTSIRRCNRCGGAGVLRDAGAGKGPSVLQGMTIRRRVIAPDGEISFEYVVCRDD